MTPHMVTTVADSPPEHRPPGSIWTTAFEAAGVISLTVAAAVIRWAAMRRNLWLDEMSTSWVVRDSLADILPRSMLNNLSPLYYILTWLSTRLAGYDAVGLRLPSFLAGVSIVPAIYLVARKLTGLRAGGFLTALIVTIDGTSIYYSTEARPYALVQLFALVNIILVICYHDERSPKLAMLIALNATLLFYLHYTTALFVAVNGLILLLDWLRGPGPSRREWLAVTAAAAAFAVLIEPALSQILYLISNRHTLASHFEPVSLEQSLVRFNAARYVFLGLPFAAALSYVMGEADAKKDRSFPCVVMLMLWFLVPCVTAWGLGKLGLLQVNIDRYVIGSAAACALLPAVGICTICPGRRPRAIAFAVLLTLLTLWETRLIICEKWGAPINQPSWRGIVDGVNSAAPPEIPIFVNSGLAEARLLSTSHDPLLVEYLLCTVNSAYALKGELLDRAIPVDGPRTIADRDVRNNFVFLGYSADLESLKRVASDLARRQNADCEIRFLVGDHSARAHMIAVLVEFKSMEG
jgi:hypothetical protein